MRDILRNETSNSLLIKRGYIQHQLLSSSEIQYLLDEVRKLYPETGFLLRQDELSQAYVTNSYIETSQELREVGPKVIQKVLSPYIDKLFNEYRILYCGLFVKAPKGGWLDIHYHPTVVDDLKHWVIDIWCPLLDADISNGTLCVVPESHKIFPEIIDHPSRTPLFCQDYASEIREKHSVALPSRAGQAVIFEDSMLHWSPQNTTDYPRYAIHCTCIPKEATAVHIHFDPSTPQQFEMYEGTDKFFEEIFGRLLPRPDYLNLLKTIPNENQPYSYKNFEERLQRAAQIRHELFPESQFISEEEFIELLKKEECLPEIHRPIPVSKEIAAAPLTVTASVDMAMKPEKTELKVANAPTLLNRIAAAGKRFLGVKPRTKAKPLSLLQTSGVVRDARIAVNQHTVSDVMDYYNEWTQRYVEGFGEVFQGARPNSTEELLEYLIQSAQLEDGLTILDAGCGVCGPAIEFAKRRKNLKIEALTLSKVQVEEAKQRIDGQGLQNRINVRQGDFHKLAQIYPPNSFDRVLFLESLCHAEDYRTALSQAKQILKPGGYLYIKDFYAVDNRAHPELLELQAEDLRELNRIYCLTMPDIPSTVDIISELGFDICYMRQPTYTYSPAAWENFMRHSNVYWMPKLGNPDRVIRAVEFFACKLS